VLLLNLIIDLKEKVNVLRHDLSVLLLVNILILHHHLLKVVNIVLKISSLVSVFTVKVSVTSLIFDFLFNVLFMEANNSSLEFLEVSDVV